MSASVSSDTIPKVARPRPFTIPLVFAAWLAEGCVIDRVALGPAVPTEVDASSSGSPIDAANFDAPTEVDASWNDSPIDAADTADFDALREPDAADFDAPRPLPTFIRVQYADAEGIDPTATFDADPRPGHLLVAIAFHRYDELPLMLEGWNRNVYAYFRTAEMGEQNRRGLAVFSRVADGTERTVRLPWSPPESTQRVRLLVQEFTTTTFEHDLMPTWRPESNASSHFDNREVFGFGMSIPASTSEHALAVAALGFRGDPGPVTFDEFAGAVELRSMTGASGRSVASAFAAVPPTSMLRASWSMGRLTTAAVVVFGYER